ncbi:hypothetical protein PLICRDRAFT_39449 [Plicaturopsis crispa FD-325 SS-3]|nr:hypothetical protein PLICRDRAFT_39449 [Plicaturopsis crispa FD-325 SS-3]
MTSYLRSWLTTGTSAPDAPNITVGAPTILEISPPPSDQEDEGESTEVEDTDDTPPAFPALSSAQRAKATPSILTGDAQLMPPPPVPSLAVRRPGTSSLAPPPSSSLAPPSTTVRPAKSSSKRAKVALAPGHGALDWANLKSSGEDLRGVTSLIRVPPSLLKRHNKRADAWSAFNGKVYNITPYLPFHPGGERELMRVAGRDGSDLFAATHAWVNVDYMLDECLVGFLVPEPASEEE